MHSASSDVVPEATAIVLHLRSTELSSAGVYTVRGRPFITDAVGATLLSHGDEGAITETH